MAFTWIPNPGALNCAAYKSSTVDLYALMQYDKSTTVDLWFLKYHDRPTILTRKVQKVVHISENSRIVFAGDLSEVDVTAPSFKADPFPFYARLRAEAPVFQTALTRPFKRHAWLVTRYEDALAVLKDERMVKDPRNAMTAEQLKRAPGLPAMFKALDRSLLSLDKPDHTRLRNLVQKAFTPGRIEQMRTLTQNVTNSLLDAVQSNRSFDAIAEFAEPLPVIVIGRILGVPAEDNVKFRRWTKAIISSGTARNPIIAGLSLISFMHYLKVLIRKRTASPGDDLISALVQTEDNGQQMAGDEVLAMIFLLLSAGHETTVNLIGSGLLALLQHPEQWSKLGEQTSLINPAVEELLRFVCPVEMATERYAREDLSIAGRVIPRGELVLAVIGSANRDEAHFANPDMLDISREKNKHLAFGQGAHYCLGAALSRMEGQIALAAIRQRLPGLRLSVPTNQLQWRGSFLLRGLTTLPVSS